MANRNFQQFQHTYEKGLVKIPLKISIAAGGAVSSFTGKGISTVTQSGAGEYTITLVDKFIDYYTILCGVLNANQEDLVAQVVSADPTGTKQIVVNLLAATVPTNPTNATVLMVEATMKNSSV